MGGNIRYSVAVQAKPKGAVIETGVSRSEKKTARKIAQQHVNDGAACALLITGAGSVVETIPSHRARMVLTPPRTRAWWEAAELPLVGRRWFGFGGGAR